MAEMQDDAVMQWRGWGPEWIGSDEEGERDVNDDLDVQSEPNLDDDNVHEDG